MPATSPSVLLKESKCFGCLTGIQLPQQLRIALEVRTLLALNPAADVTPSGLVQYGKCYCAVAKGQSDIAELALLDQISQAL
jgi:hypothetical protein